MRKNLHFFQSDKIVPDKQVVAFYFRVRQRLLSVVVVEFVESELVSVGYFDLFLSKNFVFLYENRFSGFFLIFFMNFSKNVYLDFSCILWDSCKWNESPVIWLRGWVLVQWFTRWWSRSVYLNTKSIGFTRSECALGCEKHIFHA